MKFRLYSDLHVEFGGFTRWPRDSKETVLLLSGDIGVGLMARNMIQSMCKSLPCGSDGMWQSRILRAGNR
jgi:hypothetical protein